MHDFFRVEIFGTRHQLTFVGNELRIYLPENYLEEGSAFAAVIGSKIETMGIFWFEVDKKKYELALPLKILFEFTEQEKYTGKISPEIPSQKYDVFILKKGDAFCYDLIHKPDIEDLRLMIIKIIDAGKMPSIISYTESITLLLKLLTATKTQTKLGVASSILEILLSELYRNKHDQREPFRKLLNSNPNASEYEYKMVKLNSVPKYNSTFNSFIGEDTFTQLSNCVVRTRTNAKDRASPLEKLLKL